MDRQTDSLNGPMNDRANIVGFIYVIPLHVHIFVGNIPGRMDDDDADGKPACKLYS